MKRAAWALLILTAGCRGAGHQPRVEAGATATATVASARLDDLAKFRAGLHPTDTLSNGEPTRDALVRRFVTAVAAGDTLGLRRLALSRAEFAYVYYPSNPQGFPPYDLHASLMWFMLSRRGEVGAQRLLTARAGHPLRFISSACDSIPSREGENTVWGPCAVRYARERGDTVSERLFGLIVERRGRYKFLSYANKLD